MGGITDELALLIKANVSGTGEIAKLGTSVDSAAVAQDKLTLSTAKTNLVQAQAEKTAAALAVNNAKLAGDSDAAAVAQERLKVATSEAKTAMLVSRDAAAQLAVSEDAAALSAKGLAGSQETTALSGLGNAIGGITKSLGSFGTVALVAGALMEFKFVKAGIDNFYQLGITTQKYQAILGGTSKQIDLLLGQFQVLKIDPEAASKAFVRMGAAIGDGTSKLGDYGISVKRAGDGTVDLIGTFEGLRDAYEHSNSAVERDVILKQLSIRGATVLIPLLKSTTGEIKDMNSATTAAGLVLNDKQVKQAIDWRLETGKLSQEFKGLETEVGKEVLPIVLDLAKGFNVVARAAEDMHLPQIFGNALIAINPILGPIKAINDITNLFSGSQHKAADEAAKLAAQQEAVASAYNDQIQALDKIVGAVQNAASATDSLATAQATAKTDAEDFYKAEDDLDKLLIGGAAAMPTVIAAQKSYDSASKTVTSAIKAENAAQEQLNKARVRATDLDIAEANSKITLAGDAIGSAKAAEQKAKEALDKLLGSGAATKGDVLSAEAAVKDSHDRVTAAILAQRQSVVDLAKTKQKGTEGDPAVLSAEEAVKNAHDNTKAAQDAQTQSLKDLQREEGGYAAAVQNATDKVATANANLASAEHSATDAALAQEAAQRRLNAALLQDPALYVQGLDAINSLGQQGYNVAPLVSALTSGGWAAGIGSQSDSGTTTGSHGAPARGPDSNGRPFNVPAPGTAPWSGPPTMPHDNRRAAGGPVSPYGTYLVGEDGPELLHMGADAGRISPNRAGAAPVTVVQHFEGLTGASIPALAAATARESAWALNTVVLPNAMGGRT